MEFNSYLQLFYEAFHYAKKIMESGSSIHISFNYFYKRTFLLQFQTIWSKKSWSPETSSHFFFVSCMRMNVLHVRIKLLGGISHVRPDRIPFMKRSFLFKSIKKHKLFTLHTAVFRTKFVLQNWLICIKSISHELKLNINLEHKICSDDQIPFSPSYPIVGRRKKVSN